MLTLLIMILNVLQCSSTKAAAVVLISATLFLSAISESSALYLPGAGEITRTVKNIINPDGGYDFG